MSNGTPPARPDNAINTRWLFPQERAPSPPRDEGCKQIGFGDPALLPSNGSPPTPSPPSKSTPPPSSSTTFPTLVTMGGIARLNECEARLAASEALLASTFANLASTVANFAATLAKINARLAEDDAKLRHINARLAEDDAKLEAIRARLGMAPSVHIPSTTTTWMSSPTAAGSTTLRIEEVCARQDAHLEALMADFRSFADDLDQRQPSTHASIASLDDDDDDEKDEDIHIVLSIDDDDVDLASLNDDDDKDEDIHIVLSIDDDAVEFEVPPPLATSLYGYSCAIPGGGTSAVVSQHAVGF